MQLIERVQAYLDLLDKYNVGCERVESDAPGKIIYEDDVQIVVTPLTGATKHAW